MSGARRSAHATARTARRGHLDGRTGGASDDLLRAQRADGGSGALNKKNEPRTSNSGRNSESASRPALQAAPPIDLRGPKRSRPSKSRPMPLPTRESLPSVWRREARSPPSGSGRRRSRRPPRSSRPARRRSTPPPRPPSTSWTPTCRSWRLTRSRTRARDARRLPQTGKGAGDGVGAG